MDHHYDVDTYEPFQFNLIFDTNAISDEVIAYSDVNTKIAEDLYKFVSGSRSMDEWDSFIQELYDIGMAEVEAALTEQYNKQK